MNANPSCQNCVYRQPDERPEYSMSGFCHRFPPQIIFEAYDGGINCQATQNHPWVTPDDWCGEYRELERPAFVPEQQS